MSAIAKQDSREYLRILENIRDEKVRYFFLMLGEAIAECTAGTPQKANTSPAHLAEIAARLKTG